MSRERKMKMLRQQLNEWVEKVVNAYETKKEGDMINRLQMLEDVENILSQAFDMRKKDGKNG